MWPDCKPVHGKPRHSQSQGSIDRANRVVEGMLACWMRENSSTNWSDGLRFVQCRKNNRIHSDIKQCLVREDTTTCVAQIYPDELCQRLETEEQLAESLNLGSSAEESEGEEPEDTAIEDKQQQASNLLSADVNDSPFDMVIRNTCTVCEADYEGSTQCSICSIFCHDQKPCSVTNFVGDSLKIIYQLSEKKKYINLERCLIHASQVRQAD